MSGPVAGGTAIPGRLAVSTRSAHAREHSRLGSPTSTASQLTSRGRYMVPPRPLYTACTSLSPTLAASRSGIARSHASQEPLKMGVWMKPKTPSVSRTLGALWSALSSS